MKLNIKQTSQLHVYTKIRYLLLMLVILIVINIALPSIFNASNKDLQNSYLQQKIKRVKQSEPLYDNIFVTLNAANNFNSKDSYHNIKKILHSLKKNHFDLLESIILTKDNSVINMELICKRF